MKNDIRKPVCIILLFLVGVCCVRASVQPKYCIVVDAGSSGSRIYLYKSTKDSLEDSGEIKVESIKLQNNKTKPGISSIAGCPDKAGEYIQPLINCVNNALKSQKIDAEDVNFYLLATAGMRIVPPLQQKNIYSQLKKYLKEKTKFKIYEIATIPGKYEGVFAWIAYNYLAGKLFSDNTKGVLDMGGASVQITFETNGPIFDSNDKISIKIGPKSFILYSRSYLGLGADLAVSQFTNNPTCFPKDYPLPDGSKGNGEFLKSLRDIDALVNFVHKVSIHSTSIPDADHFVGFSNFYYTPTSKALNLGQNISIKELKQKGDEFGKQPWAESEKKYGSDQYLYSYYFKAALISVLLERGFGFNENTKFQIAEDVNGTDITWALGAVLYYLEGNADVSADKKKDAAEEEADLMQKQNAA